MLVVIKTSAVAAAVIEYSFSGVSKGRMPNVVHQGERLDQVFIESQFPADGTSNRCDFQRVRQTRAMIIA
jgi:hypothetical protein